jgi:hypothetical protein
MLVGGRVARWAEEEEAGMDVGIACACSQRWVSVSRCETRLDGPGFAHWLTQQQSLLRSESCRSIRVDRPAWRRDQDEPQRGSAGVKGRGSYYARSLAYSGRHARGTWHLARTHDTYTQYCPNNPLVTALLPITHVAKPCSPLSPLPLRIRPCPMRRPERRRACAGTRA